jgi:hypothetical protein
VEVAEAVVKEGHLDLGDDGGGEAVMERKGAVRLKGGQRLRERSTQ